MIGVDANVLIRFLTKDNLEEFDLAVRFFRERSSADPAYVSSVALAETIWVLRRGYRYSMEDLTHVVSRLLSTSSLIIAGSSALKTSDGPVKPIMIADFLIAHFCETAGCKHVVTFDEKAAREVPGMELLT